MTSRRTPGRQIAAVTPASLFVVARVCRFRRGIGGVEDDDNEEEELRGRALTREAGDGNHDSEEDDDDNEGCLGDNDNDNIGHLCALFRAISSGSFCPRVSRILLPVPVPLDHDGGGDARDDGDVGIAPGILPRISALLGHPSADPAGAAFSRDAPEADDNRGRSSSSSSDDVVSTTIVSLLLLLRTVDAWIAACRDLLNLSDDLGGLDDCGALFNPATTKDDNHHGLNVTDEGDAGGRRVEDYHERKGGGGETRRGHRGGGDARDDATANSTRTTKVGGRRL